MGKISCSIVLLAVIATTFGAPQRPVVGPGGVSPPRVGPGGVPPPYVGPGGVPPLHVGPGGEAPPPIDGPGGEAPPPIDGPGGEAPPPIDGPGGLPPPLVVASPTAGGLGSEKRADNNVKQLVEKLKPQIIQRICAESSGNCAQANSKIEAVAFKEQTVAGVNYFVKLLVADRFYYHVRIHQQWWTDTLELTDLKGPVQKQSTIAYF